jgi:multidrug efflux system membrane fusion protein
VVVALVRRQDVPITLSGIGAVAALNTVTIRSRVDGQLVRLNFAEGQIVAEGDVLAQIDPAPFEATLRQMTAALHRDQARLTNATADLGRYSALAQSSFASRQSVDTQQATVEQIGADIEADQAQIENARLRLSYTTIRSPIAGRVGFRLVDAGNLVDAADRSGIVVVTQQQPIAVVFSLPEHDLGPVNQRLTAGRELRVTITSRDAEAALASGVVATIDSAIDQHTATFRLKALFANKDLALWPGQFVKARLLLTTRRDGLVVPAEAVQRGPDGAFAFVVTASGTVEMRPITVAQIADGTALIDRGLEARERVVIDGQYRLRPGSRVTVVEGPA